MRPRWSVSLLVFAACGGGGGFPDAPPIPDTPTPGKFSVEWSVIDSQSRPLACDRVDGVTMTVVTRNLAIDGGNTQIFTCSTGMGSSEPLAPGSYSLDFELTSPAFGLLATATQQGAVAIEAGNDTHLDPVVFQVDATGALALTLGTAGNCAAMDTISIALTHASDGACEPIVLSVGAGATSGKPASSYTINCAAPTDVPCIESDQLITATGVASDQYTIRLRGKKGGTACQTNNDTIRVPPLGMTLTRTLNFAPTGATGC